MIRCIHLRTGDDQESHFEEGRIVFGRGQRGDLFTDKLGTASVSFRETKSGGTFAWHTAPARQLVITLSGTLEFHVREGQHFLLRSGDILFAEDTTGSGHRCKLVDDQPWRRAYVILALDVSVPFRPIKVAA